MKHLSFYAIFLIPVSVGIIVQTIKFVLYSLKHGWNIRYAFTHGHMPSAHTSFAISLVTATGIYEGIHTGTFAVSAALAFLIIDDAARLRMYLGDQGRYLNMIVGQMTVDENKFPRLKERTGHKMSEIIVGGILGFVLTLLFVKLLS
jgi:acid phosphatase family membrane protein YuiD